VIRTLLPSHLGVAAELGSRLGLLNVTFQAKGAFKETFRAENAEGDVIALKLLDASKCDITRTSREIEAVLKCDSPYIAKLYDSGRFESQSGNRYFYYLEEYLDGGTLTQRLNSISPVTAVRHYGVCLVHALEHLKRLRLVHRDIKPDNIMFRLGDDNPVLVDFGLVRDLSASSLTQTWLPQGPGTPYYAAPEQLHNDKPLIGWRTDQFSLGIVLAICLTGTHPFERPGMSMAETVVAIGSRQLYSKEFSDAVEGLGLAGLKRMLAPWPIERYSSPAEILAMLSN
jgi:serine/threonine protein kinase